MNKQYGLIRESLQDAVNDGEIDIAFAEKVNSIAYNKYMTEDAEKSDESKDKNAKKEEIRRLLARATLLSSVTALTALGIINHRKNKNKFNAVIKFLKDSDKKFIDPSSLRMFHTNNLMSVENLKPISMTYAKPVMHEYKVSQTNYHNSEVSHNGGGVATSTSDNYSVGSMQTDSNRANNSHSSTYRYEYFVDKSCDVYEFVYNGKLFMICARVVDGDNVKVYFDIFDSTAKKYSELYYYYALGKLNCESKKYNKYVLSLYNGLPDEYKIKNKK